MAKLIIYSIVNTIEPSDVLVLKKANDYLDR